MTFHEKLRDLMREKAISVTSLSDSTGISKPSISLYANGKATPRYEKTYEKLAEALGCTVAFLRDGENVEGGENVSVSDAAELLGVSQQFIRVSLQQGLAPFGFAVKITPNRWTYHISPSKLREYIGA